MVSECNQLPLLAFAGRGFLFYITKLKVYENVLFAQTLPK
jgi:hypothetical protein